MASDLSLVETSELLRELGERCEACIFFGFLKASKRDRAVTMFDKGDPFQVIGMAELIKQQMLNTRILTQPEDPSEP